MVHFKVQDCLDEKNRVKRDAMILRRNRPVIAGFDKSK